MRRWFVVACVGAAVAGMFVPGSGLGSSSVRKPAARQVPAALALAIHARFGVGPIRMADSPTEHPMLGYSVALSADGTTALVGATGVGNLRGAAYIYHVADAGSWASSSTPTATLTESGSFEGIGWWVALSADGSTAFVSAPFRNSPSGLGAVLVFRVADETSWASTTTPTAVLSIPNANMFGDGQLAVSADGTTLVAGDPDYDYYKGAAHIFHVATESSWASTSTPTATLTNAAQPASDNSVAWRGVAISQDGTTVLLSDAFGRSGAGGAYLFHVASEASWLTSSTPTAILTDSGSGAHDHLGLRLALSGSGTTAFLAAPFGNANKGAVDVFHVASEAGWATTSTPTATLTNGGGVARDNLGYALTASADGATVAASAVGVDKDKGATYVFHTTLESAWATTSTPTATLTNSAAVRGDLRGLELASSADGATVLIGSPYVNWRTGSDDVFHAASSALWATSSTPTATLTNAAFPKPLCVVPNVLKLGLSATKYELDEANCRLGTVKKVHAASKKQRRRVVAQSPAPRRHLPPGSKVNVKIGK
jgi:hypothetical protein